MPCCQFADDDTLASNVEDFDCQDCPIMEALEEVWPENQRAWSLFHRMCSRFTNEFGVVPVLMGRVVKDMDPDDAIELSERLSVIYDKVCPPPPQKT